MPPPLVDASGDASNASIIMLWANFSNSLTLLTTVPSVNDFLKAMDGPFARLRSLVGQHTSTKDMPQFQPLAPLEDVVKNIVQELWGHTSVKAVRGIGNILDEASVIDDLSFEETNHFSAGLDSQDAASLRKSEHLEIEEKYPDRADEVKAFYDKVLVHYGDIILSKDERETQPNESLHLLQKMTGKYAAQVCALSSVGIWDGSPGLPHLDIKDSTHPIGVTVVGFVADETVPPEQSTVAFTSSPIMAEMVKAMGLPLTEDAALAIRNLYDGIKAFSPYQPDISKQRSFLRHLRAFTNLDKSNNEKFGTSGLMKSVVATARQSVHFHDSLDKYLMVKTEAMDENDIDYHTPILKRKDSLAMADRQAAAWLKTMIQEATCVSELGTDWRVANVLPFLLEHHLRFAGWHCGIRRLNESLPCDWTPCESARGMMRLYHSDPEQKLKIETMTEEEYEKREVLHYAPDANGSVGKYMLPENEARRAVAKAALTVA
ncbi:uncharacterized protein EI90DRAFT_3133535 [Cantharellus anzutake]|uniref:uncharacterized protein n=1 Tax=Cantharellus anzutake TaxID=1750568 RepID=UPI001908C08E|nr:uncharacterized protein EI90DRAFT_3133535 [Cantharellus anzutake]KAF8318041.1 hypothetical protein EI90DRAFT_3133535 [Cantharellus anzutake]